MTVRSMAAAGETVGRRGGARADKAASRPAIPQAGLVAARNAYAGRRRRERFLAADLFGEPTWDILLDLYIAAGEGRSVPTTSACIGAHVPPTTALRWLRVLEARGLVEREDDGADGRRTFVCLTSQGIEAMNGLMMQWHAAINVAPRPTEAILASEDTLAGPAIHAPGHHPCADDLLALRL